MTYDYLYCLIGSYLTISEDQDPDALGSINGIITAQDLLDRPRLLKLIRISLPEVMGDEIAIWYRCSNTFLHCPVYINLKVSWVLFDSNIADDFKAAGVDSDPDDVVFILRMLLDKRNHQTFSFELCFIHSGRWRTESEWCLFDFPDHFLLCVKCENIRFVFFTAGVASSDQNLVLAICAYASTFPSCKSFINHCLPLACKLF